MPSKWTWVVQGKEHSRRCWCSIQVSWVSFTLVPCTPCAPNGSHLQHFQELALGTPEQHPQEVSGSYALFIAVTVCKQWLPNAWYKGTNPHSCNVGKPVRQCTPELLEILGWVYTELKLQSYFASSLNLFCFPSFHYRFFFFLNTVMRMDHKICYWYGDWPKQAAQGCVWPKISQVIM